MEFLPTKLELCPDDWVIEVRFRGLMTGREVRRRIGVSGFKPEAEAILAAWHSLRIQDPDRIIDTVAKRRVDLPSRQTAQVEHRMQQAAQKFTRRTA
jgi:hypothetical protein